MFEGTRYKIPWIKLENLHLITSIESDPFLTFWFPSGETVFIKWFVTRKDHIKKTRYYWFNMSLEWLIICSRNGQIVRKIISSFLTSILWNTVSTQIVGEIIRILKFQVDLKIRTISKILELIQIGIRSR